MANANKTSRVQVSNEEFAEKYIELFNQGLDSDTGESSSTVAQVAEFFNMASPESAYQKMLKINRDLKAAGFDSQLPKMRLKASVARVARQKADLSKIAAMAASVKARESLALLD